ncbi:hypothetical protein QVD17_26516 [Tagetes erecta]|uniref:Protein kinase domain-containing protein n=1 Tax=Tagetes erecta TaxID=13708 RepID=A0AAD8K7K2_TARER|nr:hypothetical protein QVD17_26516 [Tagetes erecta]
MMKRQKSGKGRDHAGERVVLIAVKSSKIISRNALIWALTHVVQPGDCAKLLVVIPAHTSSHKLWKSVHGDVMDQKEDISESCSQMMHQLHDVYDPDKIKMKIKVVSGSTRGVVAAEAKKTRTQWVVLDKNLKKEAKVCMDDLQCNVVVINKSRPKVLRLNLIESPTTPTPATTPTTTAATQVENSNSPSQTPPKQDENETIWKTTKVPNVTPVCSPEHTSFTTTTTHHNTYSLSSLDLGFSPFVVADHDWDTKIDQSDSDSENTSSPSTADVFTSSDEFTINPITDKLRVKFSQLDHRCLNNTTKHAPNKVTRKLQSLPLCSICRDKPPLFGSPPKRFTFNELEDATDRFSEANFLAEGGFGSVHKGILKCGRIVAVKQHKLASSQGDNEFFSEVEVLSCAQHRNVVMLVGFCVEGDRRLLVYEYVCNGSLDSHLYGQNHGQLEWSARQKIAIGAARGLRYLHEECRVGCIVHRDMRPNNLLLTHDFEVLVGDFGLARWQPDGETGAETRIIGTFGYLAPEYAQSGEITEKADVYSFGVVLIELITGRKAVDINRPKGQQYLTEWARPLLKETAIAELIDPLLKDNYSEREVQIMSHCAWLCIRRDSHLRPRMSQVLWMLENNDIK